jgi:NAD(P)-dependent dehydrogenase (short-subunit alcohol dehydrogenase family)
MAERVVLVTGAAGGIGSAITKALIAAGHSVAAVDRDATALARLPGSERLQPIMADLAFNWEDPLDLDGELTEEERMVRDTARGYAQDKLLPRVLKAYREERFDREIMREMGALGLLGATIPKNTAAPGSAMSPTG